MINGDVHLKQHVEDELLWEPSINSAAIGVSVHDAIVTLSGHVESYAQKHAASEAVSAIRGVRAVANELEVKLPVDSERSDEDIAHSIASIFTWNASIPKDRIRVEVSNQWVTLEGSVEWQFQRMAAEAAIKDLMGIRGVTNAITVARGKPERSAEAKLRAALRRRIAQSNNGFEFAIHDTVVNLSGSVPTPAVRSAIEYIAWKTPGIVRVQNDLKTESLRDDQELG